MNHNEFWNKQPKKLNRGYEAIAWMILVIAAAFSLYHILDKLQLIK